MIHLQGVLFVDPNTLPDYKPAKKVYFSRSIGICKKGMG